MQNFDFVKTVTATAIAGVLGVAAVSPASAVVYRSRFDPVSFEGTATFDVSEACLSEEGFVSNGSYDGCTIEWLTAEVTLKEPPSPITETFTYEPTHLPSVSAVNEIFVQSGELAGVSSDIIGPVTVSESLNPSFNGPWWIQFTFGISDGLVASLGTPIGGAFNLGEVLLWGCPPGTTPCTESNREVIDTADVEFFAVVPEPATTTLAFAALWAAWFARRRIKYRL